MTQTLAAVVFTHRCTVQRKTQVDQYALPEWSPLLTGQVCFLHTQSGDEKVAPERTAVVDAMRMMVPKGTGITANDRITSVTRDGVEILLGVANIVSPPRDHHDHDEFDVQLVSGGG